MATGLTWAGVVSIVAFLFVDISQSEQPTNGVGGPCQDDRMCQVPESYCRLLSHTCECKSGYTHSTNKDKCIRLPEKADIGSHCITDVDCAFTVETSRCSDNSCRRCADASELEFSQCQEPIGGCAYHEYNRQCFKYRKIGEPCELSEECWIFPNSDQTRNCTSSICQCLEGHHTMSGPLPPGQVDQCIKKDTEGEATASSISMVVLLIALMVSIVT